MQKSRRDFAKKSAIVVGATAVGSTVLAAANTSAYKAESNGVVVGNSNKKEIIYKKTKAWEDYYKQAL